MSEITKDEAIKITEAAIFMHSGLILEDDLQKKVEKYGDVRPLLNELQETYKHRGIQLVKRGEGWAFRTDPEIAPYLSPGAEPKKLSRAAMETLAIIAYHGPITRAEIESIRGVSTSRGIMDPLLESGWIKPGRKKDTPGKPYTWLATDSFLDAFGLETLDDLPGVRELRESGLLGENDNGHNITRNLFDESALDPDSGEQKEYAS